MDLPFPIGASTLAPPEPSPPASPVPERVADRYERLEPLGVGGMGEVWRFRDTRLSRTVALKIVRPDRLGARALARFEAEARITAQLQHPGISPVHDLGRLDDGRLWFAMTEVRGRTLQELLAEPLDAGTPLRRRLEVVLRVCETVAFAHDRGVVHRDLKPANVMLGAFGEVLVLDWGLAALLEAAPDEEPGEIEVPDRLRTVAGTVAGTPAYMAPEQARGDSALAGPPADVYALGAVLYEALCGRSPRGGTAEEVLRATASGAPIPPPSAVRPVDEALERICLRALAYEPRERPPHAGVLAAELGGWLDGAARRERAAALLHEARAAFGQAQAEAEAAEVAQGQANALLAALPATATAPDKQAAWALEDRAALARAASAEARVRAVQLARSALTHDPDGTDAHDLLSEHFHAEHAALEGRGEAQRAAAALAELGAHDRRGRFAPYVRGTGAVTVITDPPGAEVRLHRFVEEGRRLVPRFERALGVTPLRAAPVEMGSVLLTLHLAGHDDVAYPLLVRRQEHCDGVAPGEVEPRVVALPPAGALGPDDRYVPGGWTWVGDDEFPTTLPLERRWVDPFVVRRFPVTLEEYVACLDALVDRGRPELAEALAPQLVEGGGPFLRRDAAGHYAGLRDDVDGELWYVLRATPRLPIVYVDLHQARGYAAWLAERTGGAWRLPTEPEWQRAGRGADRRNYPWGDAFEWSWTRCRPPVGQPHVVSVDAFPLDVSPFGVRGLAGNVAEWAVDGDGGGLHLGGSCASGPLTCRLTYRSRQDAAFRLGKVGFRLVRGLSPEGAAGGVW